MQRWKLENSPFHLRLWAAMAQNPILASGDEVGAFIVGVEDREFWRLDEFPEITELRARRFGELDSSTKKSILNRIHKGPPRSHFSKKLKPSQFSNYKRYDAAKEMKRIAIAGVVLPLKEQTWLDTQLLEFADLVSMTAQTDFPEGPVFRRVLPNPDNRYDDLVGFARLKALETALSSARNWDDDPARGARDWLSPDGKAAEIIRDLESTADGGAAFPKLWERLGWAHSPRSEDSAAVTPRDLKSEADRVLALLMQTSGNTLSKAIEGISAWLDAWSKQVVEASLGVQVWLRIWPIAVEATNVKPEKEDDTHLNFTAQELGNDREPMDLDTLNTPAGRLVGVFLTACPPLNGGLPPFTEGSAVRQMRDAIETCTGRSDLIAKHRMIEGIDYFVRADAAWAQSHLIAPLQRTDATSLPLWRALARRTRF